MTLDGFGAFADLTGGSWSDNHSDTMSSRHENTAAKRLRDWWRFPPRSGLQRLIAPYEYRHLRAFGISRVAGGCAAAAAGGVCVSYEAYEWAAFFLAIGALNLAGGYWYLAIAHSRNQRPHLRPQA